MSFRLAHLGVFLGLDIGLPSESFGQIGTRFGLFSRVAGLVGGPRRSRLIVGHAALPQRLTLGRGLRLLVRFVAVNLSALRRGGEIGSPLELGIAPEIGRASCRERLCRYV